MVYPNFCFDLPNMEGILEVRWGYFLKVHPFVAIQKMDNTAILVPVFFKTFPHDDVGFVRVDADVGINTLAVIQHSVEDAVRVMRARDAVDNIIRLIVEPLAVIDDFIGDVGAGYKCERADNCSFSVHHHVAIALFNILDKHILTWIAVRPLEGVAIAAHDFSCLVTKVEDDGQVFKIRFSDLVFHWSTVQDFKNVLRSSTVNFSMAYRSMVRGMF